ncbi:flagellar export chaperone FlgN [Phaeobacter sp. PT47_59]|uniref:flagellar export chaperone FlgN n=1 Tax=Phaeobacter sp. PT47_59 TaxID=3029979 RepID=UPI00238085DB|nr:flagellar export chaperone FlgN [Phaeobacter sp. PT47_59]MDE4172962.1 flagellar export chaperone FlgN [Phaeobacter sp. PT47_59]
MSKTDPQAFIDALDRILDEERSALMTGDLKQMESILARKEEAIDQLNTISNLEQQTLAQVQTKVVRNQDLLESAMEGIRSVAARMAELRRVRKGLDVYDSTGRKTRYGTRLTKKLEKRA